METDTRVNVNASQRERAEKNRGSDGEGYLLNENAVLGMRVVSIVPGSGLIQHHPHQTNERTQLRYATHYL